MQLVPDWRMLADKDKFERELRIKFSGPGWYLTKEDSVLVFPALPRGYIKYHWNEEQPEGTLYEVNVYNCNIKETIFGCIAEAPKRMDEQEK